MTAVATGGAAIATPNQVLVAPGKGYIIGNDQSKNDNDLTCNKPASSTSSKGSGVITAIGKGSITLDNNRTIALGGCTKRSFGSGKTAFHLKDKVNFEGHSNSGKVWASSITCV